MQTFFRNYFNSLQNKQPEDNDLQEPPSARAGRIFKIALTFFLGTVAIFSCGDSNSFDKKSYEDQKETIPQKEQRNPLNFLHVKSDNRKNLFGSTVIKGTVSNTATVCTYTAIRIKLLSYNEGRQTEEHEDVIDGPLKPGNSIDFKIKYRLPKGSDSISLSVMSAHPFANSLER